MGVQPPACLEFCPERSNEEFNRLGERPLVNSQVQIMHLVGNDFRQGPLQKGADSRMLVLAVLWANGMEVEGQC